MSTDAYQEIMTAFDPDALARLEKELGVEGPQTREATGAAVGTILEGLRRRTGEHGQKPDAGDGLEDLLEKLGMGSEAADDAPGTSSLDPKQVEDVFGDLFGEKKHDVERRFGKATRLDPQLVKRVLGAVLPIVLGALAKSRRSAPSKDGDGFSLDDILGKARKDFDRHAEPKKESGGGGILESILDKDDDGDVDLGDLASIFLDRR